MKAISASDMRLLERRTMEESGFPSERLMRMAGALAASSVLEFIAELYARNDGCDIKNLVILAGKGNNAGDAFFLARMLSSTSYNIFLYCTNPESDLTEDGAKMFREMPESIRNDVRYTLSAGDLDLPNLLIIDGLLGTGFRAPLREPYKEWIELVNNSGRPVVSLDIPSGMEADTGKSDPFSIRADLTITMAHPKKGMLTKEGINACGRIKVADIGIPPRYSEEIKDFLPVTLPEEMAFLFPREDFDIHKAKRGHTLILGGCRLYPGAPLLAGEAALRTGSGLVSCALPEGMHIYAPISKALMVRHIPGQNGFFSEASFREMEDLMEKADSIVIGPGMGRDPAVFPFLEKVLLSGKKIVVDADALYFLAEDPELLKKASQISTLLLTPHEGEAGRLEEALKLDRTLSREERALNLSRAANSTLVLKGARSVVASPDGRYAVNLSGTNALATAGTGDVLAGMAGALVAGNKEEKFTPFDLLRGAVSLHGLAGELAFPCGSRGMLADDLIHFIPAAMRKITPLA